VVRVLYDTKKQKLVTPFDLNLSKHHMTDASDQIVGCEAPGKWKLQPESYLSL
jgi:hypothetical protein